MIISSESRKGEHGVSLRFSRLAQIRVLSAMIRPLSALEIFGFRRKRPIMTHRLTYLAYGIVPEKIRGFSWVMLSLWVVPEPAYIILLLRSVMFFIALS